MCLIILNPNKADIHLTTLEGQIFSKPQTNIVVLVARSSQFFCNSRDCSPPGSSVHGISQARKLEQVAISFSRGSSRPRNWTHVFCIGRWILYHWVTWEAPKLTCRTLVITLWFRTTGFCIIWELIRNAQP